MFLNGGVGKELKKIGIFGGSFDPPHNEHVRLVESAIESLELDEVFVMPAAVPPHKKGKTLSDDRARMEMCKLAFQKIPSARVSDYEIRSGGVSYTYLTCRHFKSEYPNAELVWLVGTDMLRNFPSWKNPEEILETVTLAVCARNEETGWIEEEQAAFRTRFGKEFAVIGYDGRDVSSTKIRVLAGAGSSLTEFTPESVASYIEQNELYKVPFAETALSMQSEKRAAHSLRVAYLAATRAPSLKIEERKAVTAALFHDCAKNLPLDSPCLKGLSLDGVPAPVAHQFAGAYLAERLFGIEDEDVLNAVRYHTSGLANMSELEKLIFL